MSIWTSTTGAGYNIKNVYTYFNQFLKIKKRVLGLPLVIKSYGIIIGTFLLILCFFLALFTVNLLLRDKNLSRRSNYSAIGIYCFK